MDEYDEVFDRAEKLMSLFLVDGGPVREPPGVLLAEMAPLPGEEAGLDSLGYSRRRALPFLTKWLIFRSDGARYANPGEMLHWALMARLTAESCTAATAGSQARLADLRARAWGQLGNALRVYGRWAESREAMDLAERHRASGTGDSELRARLIEQIASLRIAERDFGTAVTMLDEALDVHEDLGETSALARALILKAVAAIHAGEADHSIQLLNRAIPLLDPLEEMEMLLIAQRNRAESYVAIGKPRTALMIHHSAARHLQKGAPRALMARFDWQEGKLMSEVGSFSLAETILLRVRQELFAMRLVPDIAYISSDLATLYGRMRDEGKREQALLDGQRLALELRAEPETLTPLQELLTSPTAL